MIDPSIAGARPDEVVPRRVEATTAVDAERLAGGRFVFLDALRGIAALSIVLFHLNNEWTSPAYVPFSALLPRGVLYVWQHLDLSFEIFFVLSGFVIAHSLAGQRVTTRYAANFVLRRSIRLDPPYWFMIWLLAIWPYLVFPTLVPNYWHNIDGLRGIVVNMFYLPDLLWRPRILGVAWTLCLEVQFYLAFLALLWIAHLVTHRMTPGRRERLRPLLAVPLLVLTGYSLWSWFALGHNDFRCRWWMFASGALIYFAVARSVVPGWTAIAQLIVLVIGVIRHEPHSVMVAAIGLIIQRSAMSGTLYTWLDWRWLQYLGRRSYSLYLVHMEFGIAAIGVVLKFGDGSRTSAVTAVVVGLLTSLIMADLMYRLIEAPAVRWSKRLRYTPTEALPERGGPSI